MLGLNYRDESTKLRYQVVEVRKIQGEFEAHTGDGKITVNERIIVLECKNSLEHARGYFRPKDGLKIPIKTMQWLKQVNYSYPYFKELIKRGTLKKTID